MNFYFPCIFQTKKICLAIYLPNKLPLFGKYVVNNKFLFAICYTIIVKIFDANRKTWCSACKRKNICSAIIFLIFSNFFIRRQQRTDKLTVKIANFT